MNNNQPSKLNLANLLTGFRFVAAPGLLWLAWHNHGIAFMIVLACAFFTDLLDGFVARLMGQVSQFGAMLDSCADVITYLTIAISCWWLWPAIVQQEIVFVDLIVTSCLLPAFAGFGKFGRFTSYHTWAVKVAAAAMGLSLYILFFGGPDWPFRIAAIICIMAALEEVALTFLLPEPESNVRSVLDVLKRSSSKKS